MTLTPPMRPSRAEHRRASVERVERVAAQDTWVMGRVMVEGTGEIEVDIKFPVTFGERPLPILGGGELEVNSDGPKRLQFPGVDVVVTQWETASTGGQGQGDYYVGARLGIVTRGRSDQRMWVPFAFVGTALTNVSPE